MIEIDDTVALIPIEEFIALDPWYWDVSADKYYKSYCIKMDPITEASKRRIRRVTKCKEGDIYLYNFHLSTHSVRPGLLLKLNNDKMVIVMICSSNHRKDFEKFPANISITTPLRDGSLDNPSHVATNRFRYLDTNDLGSRLGSVSYLNLEAIRQRFYEINAKHHENTIESLLEIEGIDSLIDEL